MVDVPSDLPKRPARPAKAQANPFSGIVRQLQDGPDGLEASLGSGASIPAEHSARVLRIAGERGMRPGAVRSVLEQGTEAERRRLENPFSAILDRSSRAVKEWARDPYHASLLLDDGEKILGLSSSLQSMGQRRSWMGDLAGGTESGFVGLMASYGHLAAALGAERPEDVVERIAKANRRVEGLKAQQSYTTQLYFQELEQAEGLGVVPAALSSLQGLSTLVAENLGFSAPSMAGAAAGSPLGPLGAAGGAFAAGTATEFGAWVNQRLAEHGVDTTDPDALLGAYRNPTLMSEIQGEALRKGITTSAVDALSVFVGGRAVAGAGRGARVAAVGRELAEQTGGEVVGEAAGQLAAVGEVDWKDAVLEGVAAGPQSVSEIGLGAFMRRVRKGVQARQDAEAVQQAAEVWRESKTAKRLPEGLRDLVAREVADQNPETRAAYVDKGVWDAFQRERGQNPIEAAGEILQSETLGQMRYREAAQQGFLEVPLASWIEAVADDAAMEDMVRMARYRPDGMTLAEVEALAETGAAASPELERTVGEAIEDAAATTLYQTEEALQQELEGLDEQIGALEQPQTEEGDGGTDEGGSADDGPGAGLPDAVDDQAGVERADGVQEAAPSADAEAQLAALRERREEVAQALEQVRRRAEAAPVADQIRAAAVEELQSAGQWAESTAELMAQPFVRAYEVLAERTGATVAELWERFPVSFRRAGESGKSLANDGKISQAPGGSMGAAQQAFQTLFAGEKGSVTFGTPDEDGRRPFDVQLTSKANLATFFHEMGHAYLEMLGDLAAAEDAPAQIVEDYAKALEWLGVESRDQIETEHHEKWARGFEAYIREGRAPSEGLRRAFAAFRAWLVRIYRDMRRLNVELSDDVRGVMDRILATDAEIEAAQYEVGSPTLPGEAVAEMDEETRTSYMAAARDAQDDGREDLTAQEFASLEAQAKAERSARMDELLREERERFDSQPGVMAYQAMTDGDVSKVAAETVSDEERAILEPLGLLTDETGVLLDAVAEEFGVTVDVLLEQMQQVPREDQLVRRAARRRLMDENPELLGTREIRATAAKAAANAKRAKLLDRERRWLWGQAARWQARAGAEAGRRVQDRAARQGAFAPAETAAQIRAQAREQIARTPFEEIRAHVFLNAAQRESRAAGQRLRLATPDWVGAAEHKRREQVNLELYRAAVAAREAGQRDVARMRYLGTAKPREAMTRGSVTGLDTTEYRKARDASAAAGRELGRARAALTRAEAPSGGREPASVEEIERLRAAIPPLEKKAQSLKAEADRLQANGLAGKVQQASAETREQVAALQERYQIAHSGQAAEPRQSLEEFVASLDEDGSPVFVPEWIVRDATSPSGGRRWQLLTAPQIHDLRQLIDGIYTIARDKDRMLTGDRNRTRTELALATAASVAESRGERQTPVGAETWAEDVRSKLASFFADGTKASILVRLFDQDRDGGPGHTAIIQPINEAGDRKAIAQREALEAVDALYDEHFDKETRRRMDRRETFSGVELSHQDRLSILAHMGNVEGRQRVSQILTGEQLAAVMASFTQSDVAWVQGLWKLYEGYFQQAVAMHERISGQTPKAVQRVPFTLQVGGERVELGGGYMPIAYKASATLRENKRDLFADVTRGFSASALIDMGFLHERQAEVRGGKLRLDQGVIVSHLLSITHMLSMREAVLDVQGVLANRTLREAIDSHYGPESRQWLDKWLKAVAADSGAPRNATENLLAALRQRTVTATLGFRVKSAVMQLFGLRQTAVRVGARWVAIAARKHFYDAASIWNTEGWIAEKSKLMAERPNGTYQRELNEMRQRLPSRFRTKANEFAFWMLSRSQLLVDRLTWLAQYEKTMASFEGTTDVEGAERQAVIDADQAVRDSQGGGQISDLSWWESGPPTLRLLTTYFTEASLKFNLTRLSASRTKWSDPGTWPRFLADMTLLYFFEAGVVGALMALSGDEEPEEIADAMSRKTAAALLDTMPGLRELAGFVQGFPLRLPAGLGAGNAVASALTQIGQGEEDAAFWRSLNMASGSLLGYPARAINDVGDAIGQVLDGEVPTALIGMRPER